MNEIKQAKLLIRSRQQSGGAMPSTAFMGEPFVNLYNGVLMFSGVTGGSFEESGQSGVFEVGSKTYNSNISNRFNINDNFIISGGTGLISTYGGAFGAGLSGKFMSGTTNGFVLGNISDIQSVNTKVQSGVNTITGGTAVLPTINLVDSPSFNNVLFSGTAIGGNASFADMSASTLYSGSTGVEDIIYSIATDVAGEHTYIAGGTNIITGGTAVLPTINLVDSPSVNIFTASGHVFTNGTTYSGGTIQDDGVFTIDAAAQVEIGSDLLPTTSLAFDLGSSSNRWKNYYAEDLDLSGVLAATGITDSSLTAGQVVYAGVGGKLTGESGFEYDEASNLLKTKNIQIGDATTTGDTTTTIFGNLVIVGDAITATTSQLYIEDNFIELNFNPTASTASTSLGAGWSIQDGSGVDGTDVLFDIRGTATGLESRSFATNLNDIRIRETGTVGAPNGVYLIASEDVVDGGSF